MDIYCHALKVIRTGNPPLHSGFLLYSENRNYIADLLRNADLDLKQRFQKIIFPEKLLYKKGSFRTAKIAFIFRHLKEKTSPDYCLAPPIGQVQNF